MIECIEFDTIDSASDTAVSGAIQHDLEVLWPDGGHAVVPGTLRRAVYEAPSRAECCATIARMAFVTRAAPTAWCDGVSSSSRSKIGK